MGMSDIREELFKNNFISKERKEAVEKEKQGESSQKYKNYGSSGNMNNGKSKAGYKTVSEYSGVATAPYNFVAVPNKAVEAPLAEFIEDKKNRGAGFIEYIKAQGNLCGEIEYTLTNLTPMYIGDHGQFFAPNGKPIIPGSTMRGLVKNYLKILSCGTMRAENNEDMTSRHLYFRDFAGTASTLKDEYKKRMSTAAIMTKSGKSVTPSKATAGFLIKETDGSYYIIPAEGTLVKDPRKANKAMGIKWRMDAVECFTGPMDNKKHYYVFTKPGWESKLPIDQEKINDYRDDKSRKGVNILESKWSGHKSELAKGKHLLHFVPCYYVENQGVVDSFGHGRYYRIPYLKSIEEHIPVDLRDPHKIDFADAIFGRKEDWAGRVSFADGYLKEDAGALEESKSHNLMGPNPTSFQLYLQQDPSKYMKHWDNDANIRGYKMYWHKNIGKKDWMFGPDEKEVKGTIPIRPLSKGNVFQGKVRFNNLSKEELGALLAVFKLSEQGCFKIGMGKPIGMGSAKCQYKLNLFDSSKLYTKLFDGDGWNAAKEETDITSYIDAFNGYMGEQVAKLNIAKEYEQILEALSIMMSWENTKKNGWNKNLEYMQLTDERYEKRVPLPSPSKVVNSEVKKK